MLYMALLLGLTGSLHCVGMCGPIALALPVGRLSTAGKWLGISLYNAGRIAAYGLLGFLAGSIGYLAELGSWQHFFSVGTGVLLVLTAVFSLAWFEKPAPRFLSSMVAVLKRGLRRYLSRSGYFSLSVLGVLNGFIPCGMVYVALLTAAASASDSTLYMTFYGLGTFPAMMATGLSGQWVSLRLRNYFRKAVPFIVAFTGLLLIMRGLTTTVHTFTVESSRGIPVCNGR